MWRRSPRLPPQSSPLLIRLPIFVSFVCFVVYSSWNRRRALAVVWRTNWSERHAAERGQGGGRVGHEGRLIPLLPGTVLAWSAERFGREIRAVGLDQDTIGRYRAAASRSDWNFLFV